MRFSQLAAIVRKHWPDQQAREWDRSNRLLPGFAPWLKDSATSGMTTPHSRTRQILVGTLSRLDSAGAPVILLAGVTAHLTYATAPSEALALHSPVAGLELSSFSMGEPPELKLEVPLGSTNELLLLLLGRRGLRESDDEPMTATTFAALKAQKFDRTAAPASLVLHAGPQVAPQRRLVLTFDSVDLTVRGLMTSKEAIHGVKLGAVVHQDYSREFVPMVGQAGRVDLEVLEVIGEGKSN